MLHCVRSDHQAALNAKHLNVAGGSAEQPTEIAIAADKRSRCFLCESLSMNVKRSPSDLIEFGRFVAAHTPLAVFVWNC